MSDDYWKAPRDELVYRLEATIGCRDEARALVERYREALEEVERAYDLYMETGVFDDLPVAISEARALLVEHDEEETP